MTLTEIQELPGYATKLEVASPGSSGWLPSIASTVQKWLTDRRERIEIDTSYSQDIIRDSTNTRISIRWHSLDKEEAFRFSMVETSPSNGTWRSEVLAAESASGSGWIWIKVESDDGRFVATPKIVQDLLATLNLADGGIPLSGHAEHFSAQRVPELIELLESSDRRTPILIAGTDEHLGVNFDKYVEQVDKWSKETKGLAHTLVLDPASTEAFQKKVPDQFRVEPWTIRTFLPGVDFSTPRRASKHRTLGTHSLARASDTAVARRLGMIVRFQTAASETPSEVIVWQRRMARIDARRFNQLGPAGQPEVSQRASQADSRELPAYRITLEGIQDAIGLESLDEQNLIEARRRLEEHPGLELAVSELESRISQLNFRSEEDRSIFELTQDQLQEVESVLLSEQEAFATLIDEIDSIQARTIWLERELRSQKIEPSSLLTPTDAILDFPTSYSDLQERFSDLGKKGVFVTADRKAIDEVEVRDNQGNALKAIWRVLMTLVDYKRAVDDGAHDGDIYRYVNGRPDGYYSVSGSNFRPGESKTVGNNAKKARKPGQNRYFPVPEEVQGREPNGTIAMMAHFEIASIGIFSPRLHLHDDTARSGGVYVGYIGKHGRVASTN